MNIILVGPPGSGKGTQGELIAKNNQFNAIITGEILRKERNSGSELGNKIKEIIDAGNLVPDEMINEIVTKHLQDLNLPEGFGILFDGYPRTVEQAEYLDTITTIDKVFFFQLKDEESIRRIKYRGSYSGRADDKDESVIKVRLENYKKDTEPVFEYYKNQGKLIEIDASKKIKEIYNQILSEINE